MAENTLKLFAKLKNFNVIATWNNIKKTVKDCFTVGSHTGRVAAWKKVIAPVEYAPPTGAWLTEFNKAANKIIQAL